MEAYYRCNTRITALIRVLPWAYYRLAPPGPPDFPENLAVLPGGPWAIVLPVLAVLIVPKDIKVIRLRLP